MGHQNGMREAKERNDFPFWGRYTFVSNGRNNGSGQWTGSPKEERMEQGFQGLGANSPYILPLNTK